MNLTGITGDYTIENRTRVPETMTMEWDLSASNTSWRHAFYGAKESSQNQERLVDLSDIDPNVFYNSIERTDPEWFVWRIVYEQSLGEISLYIDNDPTPVLQSDGWAGGGGNSLATSNQSRETIPSSLDVDYLRIANGAYHVIPEPSTLTLLIVGTLLTCVRHGRNASGG